MYGELAGAVRMALHELGPATCREMAARMDIPEADYRGRERVRRALKDLVKGGLMEGPRGKKQKKIWAACLIKAARNQVFAQPDIASLAETDKDYTKRILHFLEARGFLVRVGRRHNTLVYRVAPGQERETPPHFNRRAENLARAALQEG